MDCQAELVLKLVAAYSGRTVVGKRAWSALVFDDTKWIGRIGKGYQNINYSVNLQNNVVSPSVFRNVSWAAGVYKYINELPDLPSFKSDLTIHLGQTYTRYNRVASSISPNHQIDLTGIDAENESAIYRELGFAFLYDIQGEEALYDYQNGEHNYQKENTSIVAWAEGFEQFFGSAMDAVFHNDDGEWGKFKQNSSTINGEIKDSLTSNPFYIRNGINSEFVIGKALYDLVDGNFLPVSLGTTGKHGYNDGGKDNIQLSLNQIMKPIIDNPVKHSVWEFNANYNYIVNVDGVMNANQYYEELIKQFLNDRNTIRKIRDVFTYNGLQYHSAATGYIPFNTDMIDTSFSIGFSGSKGSGFTKIAAEIATVGFFPAQRTWVDNYRLDKNTLTTSNESYNVCNNGDGIISDDLTIENGATLGFNTQNSCGFYNDSDAGNSFPNTANKNFTLFQNTNITINSDGNLILGDPNSSSYSAIITKQPGSTLNVHGKYKEYNYSDIILSVNDPLTIYAGGESELNQHSKITANSGSTLNIYGTLNGKDNSIVSIGNGAYCEISGTINLSGTSQLIVFGNIKFKSGAVINLTGNAQILIKGTGADQYFCGQSELKLGTTSFPLLTYSWSPGDFLFSKNKDDNNPLDDAAPYLTGLTQPTTYTLTVTDQCGVSKTDAVKVSFIIADAGQDACYNGAGNVLLSAGSYDPNLNYTWEVTNKPLHWCGTGNPPIRPIKNVPDVPNGGGTGNPVPTLYEGNTVCVDPFDENGNSPFYSGAAGEEKTITFKLRVWSEDNNGFKVCEAFDEMVVTYNPDCPSGIEESACPKPPVVFDPCDLFNKYIFTKSQYFNLACIKFVGEVMIQRGVTVTFNQSDLTFTECSKFTVEEGGTLILIGSTCSGCEGRWQGFEIWGDFMSTSSVVRGKVSLLNSEIREADIALLAGKRENGIIDYSKSGGIIELRGKNIFEDNGNDIVKLENPLVRPRPELPEHPIKDTDFRRLYRGSAGCEPNPFAKAHIIIREVRNQEIAGNTFEGENDIAILAEKSTGTNIHGNTFSENLNTGVKMQESKDFTIRENIFKVSDTGIKTEKTQTETGSRISENTFVNNRIAIELSDDNHSKTEISCNKMSYTEYGIHSINTYLMNQGTKSTGAGNTFTSLETVPRLNNQLYHNGTGATMTYYYDPSQPVTLQTDANLRANAVKAQRDNMCLSATARISESGLSPLAQIHATDLNQRYPFAQTDATGLNPMAIPFTFELSPNPSEGIFTVTHNLGKENRALFEIMDLRGKKMLSIPANQIENNSRLNLTLLPNGMYLYRVREGERIIGNGRLVVVY